MQVVQGTYIIWDREVLALYNDFNGASIVLLEYDPNVVWAPLGHYDNGIDAVNYNK